MTQFKPMPLAMMTDIRAEVKEMLHAQRDELRNRWRPGSEGRSPLDITFDCRSGYYGEAFGILRALKVLGYGYFGPVNVPGTKDRRYIGFNIEQPEQNLTWWLRQMETEVLEEEGYETDHRCTHCMEKYKKDDLLMMGQYSVIDAG